MSTVSRTAKASKSTPAPALDWPAWTDADVWELNEDPEPSDEDLRAAAQMFGGDDYDPGPPDGLADDRDGYEAFLDDMDASAEMAALDALESGFLPPDVRRAAEFASRVHEDQTGEPLPQAEALRRAAVLRGRPSAEWAGGDSECRIFGHLA